MISCRCDGVGIVDFVTALRPQRGDSSSVFIRPSMTAMQRDAYYRDVIGIGFRFRPLMHQADS